MGSVLRPQPFPSGLGLKWSFKCVWFVASRQCHRDPKAVLGYSSWVHVNFSSSLSSMVGGGVLPGRAAWE